MLERRLAVPSWQAPTNNNGVSRPIADTALAATLDITARVKGFYECHGLRSE